MTQSEIEIRGSGALHLDIDFFGVIGTKLVEEMHSAQTARERKRSLSQFKKLADLAGLPIHTPDIIAVGVGCDHNGRACIIVTVKEKSNA